MRLHSISCAGLALVSAVAVAWGAEARTAAEFFVGAPAEVMPLLDRNARLDMLDYYRHQLPTPTANLLDGRSRILEESPEAISMQLSRDASVQIVLLPAKSDTVVAVIETVLTPVADSGIRFYRSDWTPLSKQPAMPEMMDFVAPDRRKEARKAEMPDALYMKADYDAASGIFTFMNTTAAYYTEYDRPEGLALIRSALPMRFDGRRFVEVPAADE